MLAHLLEIYSPTGREDRLATYLAESMRRLRYDKVEIDEVGNVIGETGSGYPRILLCGHMDTVPGRLPVRIADGMVWGRGAADAKSALAAMLLAAPGSTKRGMGRAVFAGVVDEEGASRGFKHILQDGPKFDYAVFGEPSRANGLTIGYRGRVGLQVICRTPTAHASAPWLTVNAIDKMMEVIAAIKDLAERHKVTGSAYRSMSASLTAIKGGSADNVIPGRCKATLDLRVPHGLSSRKVAGEIRRTVARLASSPVHIAITILSTVEPFEAERGSPLVNAFAEAIALAGLGKARLVYKTGTGDMNLVGAAWGIPAVTYGPGDPQLSHTEREHVQIDEFLASIKVYRRAIQTLLKAARSRPGLVKADE